MKTCRSRKFYKKAVHLKQSGHEGMLIDDGSLMPFSMGPGIVERFKRAFGISKHRNARIQRFQARQRNKRGRK